MIWIACLLIVQMLGCAKQVRTPFQLEKETPSEGFKLTDLQKRSLDEYLKLSVHRIDGYQYDLGVGVKRCPKGVLGMDGTLCEWAKGNQLSTPSATNFRASFNDSNLWASTTKNCFFPRHSFVAINAKGDAVGELQLCFECDKAVINIVGKQQTVYGLSEEGYMTFSSLCRQLQLKGCPTL